MRLIWLVLLGLTAVAGISQPSLAQEDDVQVSPISGDPQMPRRHLRLRRPADIGDEEARDVYAIAGPSMALGYERSGIDTAKLYHEWQRYNTAPYLSATHGNHYVNNYANDLAASYGDFEQAGKLPVGSLIAKDSFAMTETREIVLGPLFLMEKMPDGFSYASGNWKYTQIQPDGTVLGETNGKGSERVKYCIGCHLAKERYDHLYFVPEEYRLGSVK